VKIDTQLQTSVGQSVTQDASLNALKSDAKMANDVKEIKKLSEQFESIFLEIVLKSMRDSVQKSEFMNERQRRRHF
jgi:Rod binding domain-containing protein